MYIALSGHEHIKSSANAFVGITTLNKKNAQKLNLFLKYKLASFAIYLVYWKHKLALVNMSVFLKFVCLLLWYSRYSNLLIADSSRG